MNFMDAKLTLKIDEKVITKAKSYARKKKTSVSKLVEGYLEFITEKPKVESIDITPLVKSLSGIIPISKVTTAKEAHKKHLIKKYGN
jgi:hypothetical protein